MSFPNSAIRHRQLHPAGGPMPGIPLRTHADAQRSTASGSYQADTEEWEEQPQSYTRGAGGRTTSSVQRGQLRQGMRVLVPIGAGMMLLLLLWIGGTAALNWWNNWQDDLHYGNPRTFQMDAVVGHNGDSQAHPSHFLAVNLRSTIQIIEWPAGDPSKAKIYIGPQLYNPGAEKVVITLSLGQHHDGKVDLIVHIQGEHALLVLMNTGESFAFKS